MDDIDFRWQLQKKEFLTPLSYNQINGRFNAHDGTPQTTDIQTDYLTGAPWVTIRETFWIGFGDYCYIPDQLVRPINNVMKGLKDPIPTSVQRLPQWVIAKHFPAFHSGNFSGLSHTLEEVGDCNTRCLPLPKPTFMRDTEQGKRQFEVFRFVNGLDITSKVEFFEHRMNQLWTDLNGPGYCSPHVTTY